MHNDVDNYLLYIMHGSPGFMVNYTQFRGQSLRTRVVICLVAMLRDVVCEVLHVHSFIVRTG